jgi:hypothetical protein
MFAKERKNDKYTEICETNEETFRLNFNRCYRTNCKVWALLAVQKPLNVLYLCCIKRAVFFLY